MEKPSLVAPWSERLRAKEAHQRGALDSFLEHLAHC